MRKVVSLLIIFLLLFGLTACGSSEPTQGSSQENPSSPINSDSKTPEEAKILIAYFSRSGSTKQIADMIHEQLGGDMFRIETATSYSEDYDTVLNKAQEEQRSNARPALAAHVDNMDDYDIVFIGHPIWWGDTPMAVLTFLEEYDFTGKTVIPFCTYGSSGSGRSISSIKSAAHGATVLDGFSVSGSDANEAKKGVTEWLNGLGIFETSVPSPLPAETNVSGKKVGSDAPKGNGTLEVPNSSKPSPTSAETSTIVEGAQNNTPASKSRADGEKIRIRLKFSGGETVAVLEDNPTTQSLLAQLPITVTFDDFAGAEKIAYFPEDLSTKDAPNGNDPGIGDVACYGPWGNLVFYYKDQPYASGIIPMGRVESGLENLSGMEAGFEVTIDQMK